MSSPRRFKRSSAALLCCVAAVAAFFFEALTANQATAPTPGVDLVTFDFLALTADGTPILDLRRDELTLKIDGRAREVRSLDVIPLGGGGASYGVAGVPAPFATNRAYAGRTVLLVFNQDSIRPGKERPAVEGAMRFVDVLSPGDRVGLITMPLGGVHEEITTDLARVRTALGRVTAHGSQQTTESDKSCLTRLTLESLAGVLQSLSAVPGPKTIAFVSSGLLTPRRDAPMAGPPGMCEIKLDDFQEVGRAASAARAQFYVIQPEDFQVDSAKQAMLDPTASRFRANDEELTGLASLAGVTGGEMFRLAAQSVDAVFQRVARESSAYYNVSFEPTAAERNGHARRVELATSRSGVTLRVRPQVVIAKATPQTRRAVTTPQAMLRDFRAYDELPLRVAAYASPNPGDSRLIVTAVVEPVEAAAEISAAAFGLIDNGGRLVAQWTSDPRQLKSIPIISAGLAATGDYRLRAAAIDSRGRRGMVEYAFTVRVPTAGAVKMSGLVLGVSRAGTFTPRLQFVNDPAAMAYLELHGTPANAPVTARFELAKTADGAAILSPRGIVSPTSDPDRRVIAGTLAIGALAPDDYVVRAIVSVGDEPPMVATRTLRRARP